MCNRPLLSLLITFSLSYSREVRTSHGRAFGAFGIGERSLFVSRAVNAERSLRFAQISTNWPRRPLLPSRRRPGIEYGHSRRRGDAQILQQAHQKGEDISDLRVLKRYHNWRKKENLIVLGFTDFLDRLFSNTWLPIVAFRRFGLWSLRTIPPVRFLALRLMTGLMDRPPELAQN
jgi:hypothetical protein